MKLTVELDTSKPDEMFDGLRALVNMGAFTPEVSWLTMLALQFTDDCTISDVLEMKPDDRASLYDRIQDIVCEAMYRESDSDKQHEACGD